MKQLIDRLASVHDADDRELASLLICEDPDIQHYLAVRADEIRRQVYGTDVYLRGLIEFSSYCKNDCYYCGIRKSNRRAIRYRLTKEQILSCCETGYDLGYRTFVLQSGEDPWYTDDRICSIVASIRERYPDCAITLSLGEKTRDSYQRYYDAGANRYLLRHETANDTHYSRLHPSSMRLAARKQCLFDLKEIGYQVGAGFMIGSPYQTTDLIVEDFRFLQQLRPDMIGCGPFIPHEDTAFRDEPQGALSLCLRILSILRLLFPYVLLPATTALGSIHPAGRELGLKAGANVVMPNLSPVDVRAYYRLYDHKICTGEEAAECRACLARRVESAGYQLVTARGDVRKP